MLNMPGCPGTEGEHPVHGTSAQRFVEVVAHKVSGTGHPPGPGMRGEQSGAHGREARESTLPPSLPDPLQAQVAACPSLVWNTRGLSARMTRVRRRAHAADPPDLRRIRWSCRP